MDWIREIAKILKTRADEKAVLARVFGLRIAPHCNRCGGSGEYSFNLKDGTRCYGCGGHGQQRPKTLAQWRALHETARAMAADGRLDAYLAQIKARARARKAVDGMFVAWKDVGCDYNHLNVNPGTTDYVMWAINRPIAAAFDVANKAIRAAETGNDLSLWLAADKAITSFHSKTNIGRAQVAEFNQH